MDDLAAWLTQIWDEQEALAREAYYEGQRWLPEEEGVITSPDWDVVYTADRKVDARHIAEWSPASVLARIAADRQILALHSFHMVAAYDSQFKPIPGTEEPRCDTCASQDENGEDWPCDTIRLLALPHADRPGYQETWRLS